MSFSVSRNRSFSSFSLAMASSVCRVIESLQQGSERLVPQKKKDRHRRMNRVKAAFASDASLEKTSYRAAFWNGRLVGPLSPIIRKRRLAMDWNRVEGNWKQVKGKVKEQWGKLTDDDLDVIDGKQDQLEGRLQQRYGYAKDQAKNEVNAWFDRQKW